jgi:hypothetical protein
MRKDDTGHKDNKAQNRNTEGVEMSMYTVKKPVTRSTRSQGAERVSDYANFCVSMQNRKAGRKVGLPGLPVCMREAWSAGRNGFIMIIRIILLQKRAGKAFF